MPTTWPYPEPLTNNLALLTRDLFSRRAHRNGLHIGQHIVAGERAGRCDDCGMGFAASLFMVLCSCVGRSGQSTKSNGSGVKPAQQQKISTTIPVNQIDLNGDGLISQSEQQQLTTHDNHALLTFLCISGATIIMCVSGAWVTCRHRATPDTSHNSVTPDISTRAPDTPVTTDTSDGGDWLDSEQDFSGDSHKP